MKLKLSNNQFIIIFILISVFVLISFCQQVYALKDYVNDEYNIKFQYPDEWKITEQGEVMEIENEIRMFILVLRTEQKQETEFKIGEPAMAIQVYPDFAYPDINNLKQLSKHVQNELLKDNFYDIINYTKRYKGDIQYVNITYQTTPNFDVGKLIATELLYYNGNTGYRISYGVSPDLAIENTKTQQIVNEIFTNITQSISNNNYYNNYDNDFITYDNSLFGVSIKHPETWIAVGYDRYLEIGLEIIADLCPKVFAESLSFSNDRYSCSSSDYLVSIFIYYNVNISLEEFATQRINAIIEETSTNGSLLSDLEIIKPETDILLNGNPAKTITYAYKGSNDHYKRQEIFLLKGGVGYSIIYQSPKLLFDNYLDTANKIIRTISIMPLPSLR